MTPEMLERARDPHKEFLDRWWAKHGEEIFNFMVGKVNAANEAKEAAVREAVRECAKIAEQFENDCEAFDKAYPDITEKYGPANCRGGDAIASALRQKFGVSE